MRELCILCDDIPVPIWRLYVDYKYNIPETFILNDTIYSGSITIVHYGWSLIGADLDIQFIPYVNTLPNPIICANTIEEYNKLLDNKNKFKDAKIIYANNCAFTDEDAYTIHKDVEKQYDLVVNSSFCSYKRAYLSELINNSIYIGYAQNDEPIIPKNGILANYKNNNVDKDNFVFLKIKDIVDINNKSKIGGIFSAVEGACSSSIEYLLCGIPVISTHSIGGRDVWFNEYNHILCEADQTSVQEKHNELINNINNGLIDKNLIRNKVIDLMNIFRNNLVEAVSEIIAEKKLIVPNYKILYDELKVYQLVPANNHIDNLENNFNLKKILHGNNLAKKILNTKISWVNKKIINYEKVHECIKECEESKHFTNNGKNVINLQKQIKNIFKINEDKEVLMVCNGAMGLNALIGGFNIYFNKTLKWAVQSFTFPCSNQGFLIDSIVYDIDENMGPNIKFLEENVTKFDGIVVTNCFGASTNINLYVDFCKKYNIILLFDNAAAPFTIYDNQNHLNYGHGCMVSLHHTKPIGFGEGGFIVFNKEYLQEMKKSICFGYTENDKYTYNKYANNFKMSDISAIYINNYLSNFNLILTHHTNMIKYFNDIVNKNNLTDCVTLYKNFSDYDLSLLSCIPIIFKNTVELKKFTSNNIEAKKYYYPLDNSPEAHNIFDKIICLPLNLDIMEKDIELYVEIIKDILK